MKNVVIICGHPDLSVSVTNKTILDEIAAKCPQAVKWNAKRFFPSAA